MEGLQKTKNRVAIWSFNPTPGHRSGKDKNSNLKRYMHPNVHSRTIYNSQDMKQPKHPLTGEDKDVVHIYNGILLSHQKE